MNQQLNITYPSIFRRLFALLYDSLVITAILMLATFIALYANGGQPFGYGNILFQLYLLVWAGAYYMWFWLKNGQTIGMLAWKLKLTSVHGTLTPKQALLRYVYGVLGFWGLGLNYWWALWHPNGQSLAEKLTDTQMVIHKT